MSRLLVLAATICAALLPRLAPAQSADSLRVGPLPGDSLHDDRDPILFLMEDDDNRVYLLGSIHVLDAASYPLPDDVEAAYDDAESVAFEVDLSRRGAITRTIMRRSVYRDGRTLRDVMGESYATLDKLVRRAGYPSGFFDEYKPWAVEFSAMDFEFEDSPYSYYDGVDMHFTRRARADDKPILALETPDEQIDALDKLPERAQVQWLVHYLEQWFTQDAAFDAMVAAWHAGDEAQLAAMMNQMPKRNRLALLRDRNAAWIPKIEDMLDGSDDVLVVVGAGHLVGEDSVIAMLREKGYTLTRQ